MSLASLLPQGSVPPDHGGRGIDAVLPTLLGQLGVESPGSARLPPSVLPPAMLEGVERILLFVVDGLGARQLARHAPPGSGLQLGDLPGASHAAVLTSTAPSTTATALCTFASGLTPQEHGILGYTMYAPTLGTVVNTIEQRPVLGGPSLPDLGLDAERFFPFATGHQRMCDAGVANHALTRSPFVGTPFSTGIYRPLTPEAYVNLPDLLVRARRWLRDTPGPGFLRLYYDLLDTVSHRTHPDSEEYVAELAALSATLFRELVDKVRDPRALLVVTADHGHLGIPPERVVSLREHPDLLERLAVPPSGEGRFRYLHVRPGLLEETRDLLEERFGHAAVVLSSEEALRSGLLGRGPPHPETARRIGDLLLLAKDDWFFHYPHARYKEHKTRFGHHGGVHPEEMLVPLLAMRLG